MTTPRDLLIVSMDMPSARPVEHGDLSLALAGAEAVDLLGAGAIRVADGRIVPQPSATELTDPLLAASAAALVREAPHEPVAEWLWRRGRGLARTYLDALQDAGLVARESRRRWLVVRSSHVSLVDSPARRRAHHRWRADEAVLAALAAAIGVTDHRPDDGSSVADEAVAAVLTAVADAVAELAAERMRRAHRLQEAAADNVRRGY